MRFYDYMNIKNTFSILWSCRTIHPGGVMDPNCYSSSDYLQCHFRLLVVIYWPFLDLPQIVDQQVDPQSNRRTTIPTFSWSSAVPFHVQLLGEWHVRSVLCLFHLLTVRCYGCMMFPTFMSAATIFWLIFKVVLKWHVNFRCIMGSDKKTWIFYSQFDRKGWPSLQWAFRVFSQLLREAITREKCSFF